MQKTNNKREKSCPINNYYKYNWIKLSSQKAQTGRMDGKKKNNTIYTLSTRDSH